MNSFPVQCKFEISERASESYKFQELSTQLQRDYQQEGRFKSECIQWWQVVTKDRQEFQETEGLRKILMEATDKGLENLDIPEKII